jgi:hypothetical protein
MCFYWKNTLYVIARVVSNTFRNAPSCGHKSLCIFYEDFWKIYILKTPVNKGISGMLCSYVYFFAFFLLGKIKRKNICLFNPLDHPDAYLIEQVEWDVAQHLRRNAVSAREAKQDREQHEVGHQ